MKLYTVITLVTLCAAPALAQEGLVPLPQVSPRATVGQRIGLTDVTVTYHRPLVNGRKVWGTPIVPYGEVWRAGANEATTLEVSDPVTIEGHAVPRGRYGLFMIPTADKWTLIVSKQPNQWGAYTYDQKEDVLRATVQPQAGDFREALTYSFDELKPDSAVVTLRWEKVAVPFHVTVAQATTLDKIRSAFRGPAQWTWDGWNDAAQWCVTNKVNLDEAVGWADKSIGVEERFENLMTKADALALLKKPDAPAVRKKAMQVASAQQIYFYGRQLQAEKRPTEAFDAFKVVAERFPSHWLAHVGQARIYSAQKDFAKAEKELLAAATVATMDQQKKNVEMLLKRVRAHEDINN